MDKIWIVEGRTGEYSDHLEWLVCFYESEAEAEAFVELLSMKRREAIVLFPGEYYAQKENRAEFMKPFDPNFNEDYTGTNYACYEVSRGTNP